MCGIVGAVTNRDITHFLLDGLQRLEYRGYDSAGIALINQNGGLLRERFPGKVAGLKEALQALAFTGTLGIAHTRWATHGKPSESNAHPHVSNTIAVVHNGIIENHEQLRSKLIAQDYDFQSETDTEVIAHLVDSFSQEAKLLHRVQKTVALLQGAYGMVIMDESSPNTLVVARSGSPLVIGVGNNEHFVASDPSALLAETDQFIYLEEGDIAEITPASLSIYDSQGQQVERPIKISKSELTSNDKGRYRHYMLKEIYEQPNIARGLLLGRVTPAGVADSAFNPGLLQVLPKVKCITILACGTSYHAGLVARYWIEALANIPCSVELASEYRYRSVAVVENELLITISQSGETADTLAGLRKASEAGYLASLTMCNVQESSLVRESDYAFMTEAGTEIGVASTKAFTSQLISLLLLTLRLGGYNGLSEQSQEELCRALLNLPAAIDVVLALAPEIEELAESFADKHHALYLGRGEQYPIAMEGALKLKEISYIHAEAYAAGELKHGPLALIDDGMPVVVVAPSNDLLGKLRSNIEEVRARGGLFYIFADSKAGFISDETMQVISMPHINSKILEPIVYNIPLQLLSYYVALIKGTDVDQPRNLAKSVTVE